MQFYLVLNRQYSVADYLTTVTDTKHRTTLTKSRLSEHSLAIETGRYKTSRLPKEERFCQLCKEDKVQTELHFLTERTKLQPVPTTYFPKYKYKHPEFNHKTNINKIPTHTYTHTLFKKYIIIYVRMYVCIYIFFIPPCPD